MLFALTVYSNLDLTNTRAHRQKHALILKVHDMASLEACREALPRKKKKKKKRPFHQCQEDRDGLEPAELLHSLSHHHSAPLLLVLFLPHFLPHHPLGFFFSPLSLSPLTTSYSPGKVWKQHAWKQRHTPHECQIVLTIIFNIMEALINTHTYIWYTHTHVYSMHVCMCIYCRCVCVIYIYTYTHRCLATRACVYIHRYAHTDTHVNVCIY